MEVVQNLLREIVRRGRRDGLVRTLAINLGIRRMRDKEQKRFGEEVQAVDHALDAISYKIASMLLDRGYEAGLTPEARSALLRYFQDKRRGALERAEEGDAREYAFSGDSSFFTRN